MRACILVLLLASVSCVHRPPAFEHDVAGDRKPWTHEGFRNDPDAFQFAILSDRTGGMRPGVFASAVGKMNAIQPEFVISVGDYIQGYTTDLSAIDTQWRELEAITAGFEMPFFFLPGNHDITNPEMQGVYEARFGPRYYAFLYKDVLFLCLDTQDRPVREGEHILRDAGLLPEQAAWAASVLARHPDARWTFVLMHQPLWLYEEAAEAAGDSGRSTGWREIEAALAGRPCTVVAGHVHRYTRYQRHDRDYLVLATTGGASRLRGPAYGEFDHAVWVTMTGEGPRLANLLLEGILGHDVHTERTAAFHNALRIQYTVDESARRISGTVTVRNPFDHPLALSRAWTPTQGDGWRLHSTLEEDRLLPGEAREYGIALAVDPGADLSDLPELRLGCVAGSELNGVYPLASPLRPYLAARRPRLGVPALAVPPVLDGTPGPAEWQDAATIDGFQQLERPVASRDPVTVRLAHDDDALYVAGRLVQDPDTLRVNHTRPDQALWEDDSIELVVDVNLDERTHDKVILTAGAVTRFDGKGAVESAVGRTADGWTFEVRIPWAALADTPPRPGDRIGFNLRRNRSVPDGMRVSEWTPSLVADPVALDLTGILTLE